MYKNILFIFLLLLMFSCKTSYNYQTRSIGFYNIENLYDTINQANDDEEYLPESDKKWDTYKYNIKIKNIAQAIEQFNNPLMIGLAEVENVNVVNDLIKEYQRGTKNEYTVLHYDSKDERGVDVALIYDKTSMKLEKSGFLRFENANDATKPTRDILWGKFSYQNDTIIAMVNHWPSRRGGQETSEAGRIGAAKVARKFIDSLLTVDKNYQIVLMGDLNDYPNDKAPQLIAEKLNPMILHSSGEFGGSYLYDGKWDILDHIFVSNGFLDSKSNYFARENSGKIHSPGFLMEEYKGVIQPKRTFGGKKYLHGYSDHLPVSIEVIVP